MGPTPRRVPQRGTVTCVTSEQIQRLSDRAEIWDLVCAYARAIDRLDVDAVRSVYAADGVDHHTGFDGHADDFVAFLARALPTLGGTQHILGNHLVEIRGDQAVAETYATAVHWGEPSTDPALNYTSGLRYIDHLVKEDGRWVIAERWAAREWTIATAGRHVPPAAPGPRGSRDEHDPLTVALSALRAARSAG